jgi:hypothetical protein
LGAWVIARCPPSELLGTTREFLDYFRRRPRRPADAWELSDRDINLQFELPGAAGQALSHETVDDDAGEEIRADGDEEPEQRDAASPLVAAPRVVEEL